jgi:HK97 family phage major capsid protein
MKTESLGAELAVLEGAARKPARPGFAAAPAFVASYGDADRPFYLSDLIMKSMTGADSNRGSGELEACRQFTNLARKNTGFTGTYPGSLLLPLDHRFLPSELADSPVMKSITARMNATTELYDPDRTQWELQKFVKAGVSPMSSSIGGRGSEFIPPPAFGGIIDIMRNTAALTQAGVEQIGIPPQGSVVYGRQSDVTNAFWVGENTAPAQTAIGSGQLTLAARKLTALCAIPNELNQFSSGAASALLQKDLGITIALKSDEGGLYGIGGTNQPLGLVAPATPIRFYGGAGVATNGNTLAAEDLANMVSFLQASNFEPTAWITNPVIRALINNLRSDAASAGDKAGLFMFGLTRGFQDALPKQVMGYNMFTSNNIRRTATKGTGTGQSTLFLGDWSQMVMGMYGAVELAQATQGDTAFANNQTMYRAVAFVDFGLKRTAAITAYHNLIPPANVATIDTPTFTFAS